MSHDTADKTTLKMSRAEAAQAYDRARKAFLDASRVGPQRYIPATADATLALDEAHMNLTTLLLHDALGFVEVCNESIVRLSRSVDLLAKRVRDLEAKATATP